MRNIKVLGSGCKNCHTLWKAAREALSWLDMDGKVEYITDMERIMEYGVLRMPALVVDETVVSMGRVLTASEVEKLLRG